MIHNLPRGTTLHTYSCAISTLLNNTTRPTFRLSPIPDPFNANSCHLCSILSGPVRRTPLLAASRGAETPRKRLDLSSIMYDLGTRCTLVMRAPRNIFESHVCILQAFYSQVTSHHSIASRTTKVNQNQVQLQFDWRALLLPSHRAGRHGLDLGPCSDDVLR